MPVSKIDLTEDVRSVLPVSLGGAGGDVNLQTGTSYTVVSGDNRKLLVLQNSSAVAVTLPSPASVGNLFVLPITNIGAGTVTLTTAAGNIDGSPSLALTTNQGVTIFSDGSNYYSVRGMGTGSGGGGSTVYGSENGGYSYADLVPSSPTSYDDEFDDGSLGSMWTTYDPAGTATFTEADDCLKITVPNGSGNIVAGVYQGAPAMPFTFQFKMYATIVSGLNYFYGGPELFESSTSNGAFYPVGAGGGGLRIYSFHGSGRGATTNGANWEILLGGPLYVELSVSSSGVARRVSCDGKTWLQAGTYTLSTLGFSSGPDQVGFTVSNQCGGVIEMSQDWIRRTA